MLQTVCATSSFTTILLEKNLLFLGAGCIVTPPPIWQKTSISHQLSKKIIVFKISFSVLLLFPVTKK
jgi:hypothetical protein